MSKNEENNSQIVLNNNITQNLKHYFHHKNNSSNITPDSPSNLISMKLHSLNSNKNDQKKLIPNNNNNHSITNKINTNNINNSLQDMNNIRIKLSKISSQFSANTPKQLANIYNQLCGVKVDPSNIVVKKNLNLEMKNLKKKHEKFGQ